MRRPGIRTLSDLLDRLEQIVCSFEREVGRLNRNQQVRRGHQGVDRQQPESRRTVDDDVSVLALPQLVDLVLQSEVRVQLSHQSRLELGEADPRRGDEQVLKRRRRLDDFERARTRGSAIASYMLRSIVPWSRNEILLLAWGSRSMRSVLRPLMASAAARFTAVVVFPTPPF